MSGAGKSTLATMLAEKIRSTGARAAILDGDVIRTELWRDLGFSKKDRCEHIRRMGCICLLLAENGVIPIVAAISPYQRARDEVRARARAFVDVHVYCEIDILIRRDTKGLYKRAFAGEISSLTGISDPYEPPRMPEVLVDSGVQTPDQSFDRIWFYLLSLFDNRGLVASF